MIMGTSDTHTVKEETRILSAVVDTAKKNGVMPKHLVFKVYKKQDN